MWKFAYVGNMDIMWVLKVSNQTEGISCKKVDENPTEGTISLHQAQDQPATNRIHGQGSNSCRSPVAQAPKRKLPVTRSEDFLWGIQLGNQNLTA